MRCDPLVTKSDPSVIAGVFLYFFAGFIWLVVASLLFLMASFLCFPASVTGLGCVRSWQVDCLRFALVIPAHPRLET